MACEIDSFGTACAVIEVKFKEYIGGWFRL